MPREVKFPGIFRHASQLGCTPQHLRLVLLNKRQSPKLVRRYWEMVNEEKRASAPLPPTAEEWRALVAQITPQMRAEAAERAKTAKDDSFIHPDAELRPSLFHEGPFVEEQIRPYCREENGRFICEKPFLFAAVWFPALAAQVFIVTPKPESGPLRG